MAIRTTTACIAYGNRTSKNSTSYQIAASSNRLLQTGNDAFNYDAMGNTTAMPNGVSDRLTLSYGAHQRLVSLSNSNGASGEYTYNGRGERVKKLFRASPKDSQPAIISLYDGVDQQRGNMMSMVHPSANTFGSVIKHWVWPKAARGMLSM